MNASPEADAPTPDWSEVYRTTYRELVRYLDRKLWDTERAQDLVQEVFVRALETAPRNPRAWLFRVAANLARDEARLVIRRKKHLALLRVDESVQPSSPPSPADAAERNERVQAMRRALDRLTDRDREVLLLWDAGLTYHEIAAQVGLAAGAVGTTLARARQRLVASFPKQEEIDVARG